MMPARSASRTSHPVASLRERMRTSGVCPTRPATPSATLPRSSAQRQRSAVRWRQERAAAAPAQAPAARRRREEAGEEEEGEEQAPGPLLVGAILVSLDTLRVEEAKAKSRRDEKWGEEEKNLRRHFFSTPSKANLSRPFRHSPAPLKRRSPCPRPPRLACSCASRPRTQLR